MEIDRQSMSREDRLGMTLEGTLSPDMRRQLQELQSQLQKQDKLQQRNIQTESDADSRKSIELVAALLEDDSRKRFAGKSEGVTTSAAAISAPKPTSKDDEEQPLPRHVMAEEANAKEEQSQPQPLSLQHVVDDFSLPSQGMRFRAGREIRIYEQAHGQLILEERGDSFGGGVVNGEVDQIVVSQHDRDDDEGKTKGNGGILVKSGKDHGYAFSFLRAIYSLMAVFVGGFLFILGFCILLFLFINLATLMGVTSSSDGFKVVDFLGVLLSVPVFVYSLAMGMTLATRFVVDTFNGHPFLRSFGLGVVTTDWIAFVFYLGIPVFTFIITLFTKMDNWWEISLLTWFASILIFWCFFSACVLWLEICACLEIMEEDEGTSISQRLIDDDPWNARVQYWFKKAGHACVRTMQYRLSGTHINFKRVDDQNTITEDKKWMKYFCISEDLASEGPYSYLANKEWNPCFVQNDPERRSTLREILGDTNYVTRDSWSLEKLFCRKGGVQSGIPITQGDASITENQINSNIVCNLLGNIIVALLFIGFVVWLGLPPAALVITCILMVIFFTCVGFATYQLVDLRRDIVNNESPTLFRYWEVYQHSAPKLNITRAAICLEVLFLYLLPLIFLCTQNTPSATLFSFLGFFSSMRHYMNPRILLLECDRKDYFEKKLTTDRKKWKKKSRLYHIVSVGGDAARHFWTWVYILCVVFFMVIVLMAANDQHSVSSDISSTTETSPKVITLVDGYVYEAQPFLPYPTCRLKKGFGGQDFELADFAFISFLAYTSEINTQNFLDHWYGTLPTGESIATNNDELIDEFKNSPEYEEYLAFGSAVSYKLVTFQDPKYHGAILTIRGTQTVWDLMADAQLWIAAGLFQGLRFVLPFSEVFTPILNHMVWIVSQLETTAITKVSFYRETTGFVNYLKEVKGLQNIQVTGHSLGGGLAIITGAQSDTNAVAISGPNAMLSRDTFYPKVDVHDLNTLTFNVIPARDPIPMIDDVARLYQNINCTAAANNFVGCHDIQRSLCELQYTCGSTGRPIFCECVLEYDYPEPSRTTSEANTTQTFTQMCAETCKSNEKEGGSDEKCQRWKEEANKK